MKTSWNVTLSNINKSFAIDILALKKFLCPPQHLNKLLNAHLRERKALKRLETDLI